MLYVFVKYIYSSDADQTTSETDDPRKLSFILSIILPSKTAATSPPSNNQQQSHRSQLADDSQFDESEMSDILKLLQEYQACLSAGKLVDEDNDDEGNV